jgi:hypothetical protein
MGNRNGVVLSKALDATDADYRIGGIRDCCVANDAEVHTYLIDKIIPRRAIIFSDSEFLSTQS